MSIVFLLILLIFVIAFFASGFKLVKAMEAIIVERLGKFHRILKPGLNFVIPILDKTKKVDLRESVCDLPKQKVITKDNVTISINALLYYQIVDPIPAVYKVENLAHSLVKLAWGTLRSIIDEMDLNTVLASRDIINEKMRDVLDEAANEWGAKVNRFELHDIVS